MQIGAYGKAGNGNETETGNGNWKWKLETEMWTKKHQSLVQCFLHSVLSHYSCIVLTNGYRTGFMSHVLCLFSCTVLCDYSFLVVLMWQAMLQSSLVYMWEGLGTRLVAIWLWELYTYFILEQGQHSYSCSLVPRPTSIPCSVWSKLWLHTQALGTITPFSGHDRAYLYRISRMEHQK